MTSSCSCHFTTFFILHLLWSCILYANGCYTSIISFGGSLVDTGNYLQLSSILKKEFPCALPPYGESFFYEPTGRCSNGRLIIDFLAESLKLPFIPPYMGLKMVGDMVELGQGVNYAVAGAVALDSSFFEGGTYISLGHEMEWFKLTLSSFCSSSLDCRNLIGRSLILVGEIGGNDYNYLFQKRSKSINDVKSYVPLVIDSIVFTVNELIEIGAQTLIIPGILPLGCYVSYLVKYGSKHEEYDNMTGCILSLNMFAEYHNKILQTKVNQIRELHPNVNIIYADYYNAAMQFYRSPNKFGFTNGALMACCGGGGRFNFIESVKCGDPSSTICDHPDTYVSWDGIHFTEAAYKLMHESLFRGSYSTPRFSSLCPISTLQVKGQLSSSILANQSLSASII